MRVSVVVCEHTLDRYDDMQDAAESVLEQTYDDVELVLVSDGNDAVCERMREDYGGREDVVIHCNDGNVGLSTSRNNGAEAATGDVVAFIDDDAIADEDWVAELVAVYQREDVPAVGGKMTPAWVADKPDFLPAEFYWLVGVTHRGFAEEAGEVRNTWGSNISFRRDVFLALDGFDTDIGLREGRVSLQGEEAELAARLREKHGYGVYYNPDAEVAHKVFDYRTELPWLLDRAFWQGYSKRAMEDRTPDSTGTETDFLGTLLFDSTPARLRGLIGSPSLSAATQLIMLYVFTATVGAGYVYALLRSAARR